MTFSLKDRTPRLAAAGGAALGAAMLLGLCATPASATTLTFDFGLIGADGGAACANKCVISNQAEHFFTTGGVSVGAIGFDGNDVTQYVTQKPGDFGGNNGETGLGESNTYPHPSSSDYEVTTSTWLLIDNGAAFGAGYKSASFSIESLQNGEGVQIFAYSGGLGMLDETKLTLLATLSAPATGGVTQTIAVPNNSLYLAVQAYTPPGGSNGADIVVSQEVLNTQAVPEPATWTMMLMGFGALGAVLRRRARGAIAAA